MSNTQEFPFPFLAPFSEILIPYKGEQLQTKRKIFAAQMNVDLFYFATEKFSLS